ncbi:hypothetical protein NOF04DRAFT_13788 [Fusarium oxysporum II5]|uniref:Uncharacterized protein n=1 Tax=Fusarium odoratissimum (strain NRRL 54006) TaxID=1089451 RepID=X0K912_FUSO5|nr:uncharacterized protein FOIG_13629 [Fusarium odoratissimum NRRL 54006]EXL93494.1 hypothetical protein FOIG_13629 [Fusarium odoratissimum NRRL 54006]KAK2136015.1 hypothetical protein NOF04DRAFT_13788 [Fusarium oxysporum II5]
MSRIASRQVPEPGKKDNKNDAPARKGLKLWEQVSKELRPNPEMRLVTRDHQFQDDEDNFSDRHYRVSHRSPSSSRAGREAIIIRRPSSNSDERHGKDKAVQPTQTDLDAIYNSIHSKDVTVHVELDIVSDLDDELEEFNRLVRQGWFKNAQSFFDQYLATHKSNPWVFVQFAEMLIEMGDYKSFHELNLDQIFFQHETTTIESDALEILEHNWNLLKVTALSHSHFFMKQIRDQVPTLGEMVSLLDNPGSTEIKIVCLVMYTAEIRAMSDTYSPLYSETRLGVRADWEKVYQTLLRQGPLWNTNGTNKTEKMLFGERSMFEVILTDWSAHEGDGSTLLALLDILAHLMIESPASKEITPFLEACLLSAHDIGESIMRRFPDGTRTRPFLLWILAQSSISARREDGQPMDIIDSDNYGGMAWYPTHIGLPFYIPFRQEIPDWAPPDLTSDSFRPLEMVMKAAKENKDYVTQGLCLKEIAVRSRDPTATLSELVQLEKEIPHDNQGYLQTCLANYLVSKDKGSRERLLKELGDVKPSGSPEELLFPKRACARDIIHEALKPLPKGHKANSIESGARYCGSSDDPLWEFIRYHSKYFEDCHRGWHRGSPPERSFVPIRRETGNGSLSETLDDPTQSPDRMEDRELRNETSEMHSTAGSPLVRRQTFMPILEDVSDHGEEYQPN